MPKWPENPDDPVEPATRLWSVREGEAEGFDVA